MHIPFAFVLATGFFFFAFLQPCLTEVLQYDTKFVLIPWVTAIQHNQFNGARLFLRT